jgi:DNA polymerase V
MNVRKLYTTPTLTFYAADTSSVLELPFVASGIKAGFPSPAQDFMGEKIDLNQQLIKHPQETFYAEVDGDSMKGAGIEHGDLMVIDRSLPPEDGKIYVCCIDGEFTVKRVRIDSKNRKVWLVPENPEFESIEVTEENESFLIWGRVIKVIKDF